MDLNDLGVDFLHFACLMSVLLLFTLCMMVISESIEQYLYLVVWGLVVEVVSQFHQSAVSAI